MDRIYQKLDKLDDRLDDIQILQAIHTEQLKEHMRRSDLLEKRIEQVDAHLEPARRAAVFMTMLVKILGIVATVAGLVKLFGGF